MKFLGNGVDNVISDGCKNQIQFELGKTLRIGFGIIFGSYSERGREKRRTDSRTDKKT